jgi:micrococcal nuclease
MVLGKQVKVVSQAVDQYGRLVAHLNVDGLDVNAEQIRRGMAWEYSSYHSNQVLITLQNEAEQAPPGLWTQSNPTPPWEWRKQHPSIFIFTIQCGSFIHHYAYQYDFF